MTGKGLICTLGEHVPIEGADKIVQVHMFGETIITQKSNLQGTLGILFDCETSLEPAYASANNMYRDKTLNDDLSVVGYMDSNARIRPIKLKGVKCSALFMPINSLKNLNIKIPDLKAGQEIDEVGDVKICKKYISPATIRSMSGKQGKARENLVPTFKEHFDTDQWGRNSHLVQEGDTIIITEKLHGTSARCGYLPVIKKKNWFESLLSKLGVDIANTNYGFVVGSRRVVKSVNNKESEGKEHYYETDLWTQISTKHFDDKLSKGETVYFEIVGYTPTGELIMPSVSNEKLKNFLSRGHYNNFIDKYGETTTFNYGTSNNYSENRIEDPLYGNLKLPKFLDSHKVFVYRITRTDEEGSSIDLSWSQVKSRCEQLDVPHVAELDKFIVNEADQSTLDAAVNLLTDQDSTQFPEHIREGVCVRIENGGLTPKILKNKSFIFKVLEGIIKDANVEDIEESN